MRITMREETESPETSASLRRTIESISSLISRSYSIKMFTAKWTTIRTKLEELNSGLVAVQNCEANENPVLSGILSSTWRTIDDCHGVARRCADLSYSGKLLMQSDLDVLYSRLDLHSKKLSAIYDSGVLNHRFAIVVSRPGVGACRDDMRFYVRDLMTRMKIGDAQMKRQALINLHESVVEDDKYVKVVVEQSDIVSVLIGFLDSIEVEIQELSAKIVSVISGFDSYKGVLVGGGVLAPLIRVVEAGSLIGKEGAAKSLQRLTENSDNGWSISAHGGVTALLKLCSGGDVKAELVGPACGALKNLIGVEEIKRFVVEEGAISMFVGLIRSKDEALQINSIEFLHNVASGDDGIRVMVIKEGGIRALVRVLEYRSGCSCKVREIALRTIESLCFCSSSSVGLLIRYGFVDQLMFFLRNGDEVSIQELALKVAIRMCGATEEAKKAMGNANFMTELVKFLDSKSFEVREMAAEALSNMVSNPKNRKRFVQDDRNMGLLLQRFDPEQGNAGNKKLLLSILMSLTRCSSGRRKILNSGYLKNIENLAEAEVSDAKKLVKKLSTNRFRSMLSGIWHS